MNEFETLSEAFLHVIRNMCVLWLQAVMAVYQNANGVLLAVAAAAAAASLTQAALDQFAFTKGEKRGRVQTLSESWV